MNLQLLMNESIEKLHTTGKINEIIEKQLEKTVAEAVKDVFGPYTDFSKTVKEAIRDKLSVDLERIALVEYNVVVKKVLEEQINRVMVADAENHLKKLLDDMLVSPPKTIKLSEIFETLVKENNEDASREGWSQPTIIFNEPEYSSYHVYLDPAPDKEKYKCEFSFSISIPKEGEETTPCECYGVQLREWSSDNAFAQKLFLRRFGNMERILFWLYSGATKVIVDKKPERYGSHEYYYDERY